jgi:hypothetical protein
MDSHKSKLPPVDAPSSDIGVQEEPARTRAGNGDSRRRRRDELRADVGQFLVGGRVDDFELFGVKIRLGPE